jgi:hypothetical protein
MREHVVLKQRYETNPKQGLERPPRAAIRKITLLVAAWAARGAPPPVVGFARNTATFDVFYWLQVTNYGVLYVLFDSPPSGSNHIDVWDLCLHVQMASPYYFVATF